MQPERMSDIVERIRRIVADVLELDLAEISADASFQQDLKVDSLEKVEIAARVERAFGHGLHGEDFAEIDSVLDAVGLLRAGGSRVPPPTGGEPPDAGPGADASGAVPAERADARRAAADPVVAGPGPSSEGTDLVRRLVGRHLAAGQGARTAYTDPDLGEVSYRQLYEAARGYAGSLRALGVPSGARAVVVAQDSVATVAAILGLWWHGCVPVPVSPLLGEDERDLIAADCAAEVLHLDTCPPDTGADGLAGGRVVLVGDEVRAGLRGDGPTPAHRPDLAGPPALHGSGRAALIQYTSGSTGRPKGVRHSAAGIRAMLDGFGARLALRPDDVVLSTARMSFGYGFGSSVLCALDAGATTVLIGGAVDSRVVTATLRRHRPTVLCSVPRLYAALLDALRPGDEAVAALRLCLTAGENCPAALHRRIRETFGAPVVNCFGATELMHVVIATPPDQPMPGHMGAPVPGVTVTVRDEEGGPVPDGTEGRLHIAGPTVALGYLDRPDADRVTFADGGAYTGDLVRRDADGRLTHLCRVDDVLNLGGYKVAPAEIEAVVRDVSGVRDCAVVASRDADGLECAVAFLVADGTEDTADTGHDTLRRAVRSRIRRDLAPYKRPARIEFVDALPTTTTGKVAAHRLREQAK
ncbi:MULTISPECIES: AMP-binding protein [unclassified Streptomyces]|uniref:AMP-binding protein n=1 Tax=unclassified Streptomyces TaxID=2593676 RepID=UPI0022B6E5BF|nr:MULTISPECIES: AMP-binding protein [unclassified Streptomyces]MCZ7417484.1 AMP-binding protein [Streptomyces sp. WMMC897]MCZ7432687.1 AMP-binding protein [Streptomyces sp. WMMC1477]